MPHIIVSFLTRFYRMAAASRGGTMRTFSIALLLSSLFGLPAAAGVGPQQMLTDFGPVKTDAGGVAFDGRAFVATWGEAGFVRMARVTEDGHVVTAATNIAKGSAPRVASDGNRTLMVWVEWVTQNVWPAKGHIMGLWIGRDGEIPASPFRILEVSEFASADVLAANGRFLIAVGDRAAVRAGVVDPSAAVPILGVVADRPARAVVLGASGNRVMLLWHRPYYISCGIPEGCTEFDAEGRALDADATPRGAFFSLGVKSVSSPATLGSGFAVGTFRAFERGFDLLQLDPSGAVVAQRRIDLGNYASFATLNGELFLAWQRGRTYESANIYLQPLGDRLLPGRGLSAEQGFSISNDFDSEQAPRLAAGTSRLFTLYSVTRWNANPTHAIAFRIIDPSTLPVLDPPPAPPRVLSAASGRWTAHAEIEWDAVPGTRLYRLEARALDGSDEPRDVGVGSEATRVKFEFLQINTPYELTLIAEDESGLSARSAPVYFKTPDPLARKRRAARR